VVARASPGGWRVWLSTLPESGRQRLGALGLALGLGFGVAVLAFWFFYDLAEDVASGETEAIDAAVLAWLQGVSSPALDWVALTVSLFGSELVYVVAPIVGVLLVRQGRWGAAASLGLVTVGAELLNYVLKAAFHRARPEAGRVLFPAEGFAFPSGHAMVAAALYCFVGYVAWRLLRGWQRWACVGGLALLVLLIGWSRLYLGVHHLTDVAAGYLAGFLWTDAVILGGRLLVRPRAGGRGRRVVRRVGD
jgi:undecaprenyl-diphosphatase